MKKALIPAALGAFILMTFACNDANKVEVSSVKVTPASIKLEKGASETLSVTVYPENASDKSVLWTSANESVASVREGVVTGVDIGTTEIIVTAKNGGVSAVCHVVVVDGSGGETPEEYVAVSSITISPASCEIAAGEDFALYATVSPDDASDPRVKWISSDESVATVNQDGLVHGVHPGKVTVSAISVDVPSVSAKCDMTVVDSNGIPVDHIIIPNEFIQMQVGQILRIDCEVYPSDATNASIIADSEDGTVVMNSQESYPDRFYLMALAPGRAMVKVRNISGGDSSLMEVTVTGAYSYDAPKAVDMGLYTGVKWADRNLGATDPRACGPFFQWGTPDIPEDYSCESYKWSNYDGSVYSKYTEPFVNLKPEDDVATIKLGNPWRTPTRADFQELMNPLYTEISPVEISGYLFLEVRSRKNGNVLYFPYSGRRAFKSLYFLQDIDNGLEMMTATLSDSDDNSMNIVFVYDEVAGAHLTWQARYVGLQIRPVCD